MTSAKEKANVEALITKGIKVLIICPQDGTAAAAAAEAAREAGVKVISYDRLIRDTDAVDYYVTFDSIAVGAPAGPVPGRQRHRHGQPPVPVRRRCLGQQRLHLLRRRLERAAAQDRRWHLRDQELQRSRCPARQATLTRDEQAKIIGQVTTNWDFNTAKNLAEANLTAATAADKGNVFILAPNDGTARAIADTFGADKDVTKLPRHRPGRREGFRPVHHRWQAVDDRLQGCPHPGQ